MFYEPLARRVYLFEPNVPTIVGPPFAEVGPLVVARAEFRKKKFRFRKNKST